MQKCASSCIQYATLPCVKPVELVQCLIKECVPVTRGVHMHMCVCAFVCTYMSVCIYVHVCLCA